MTENKVGTKEGQPKIDQSTGMPIITDEIKRRVQSPKLWVGALVIGPLVGFGIGFGIANGIFT